MWVVNVYLAIFGGWFGADLLYQKRFMAAIIRTAVLWGLFGIGGLLNINLVAAFIGTGLMVLGFLMYGAIIIMAIFFSDLKSPGFLSGLTQLIGVPVILVVLFLIFQEGIYSLAGYDTRYEGRIISDNAKFENSKTGEIFEPLPMGTIVIVKGSKSSTGMTHIEYDGKTGTVRSNLIEERTIRTKRDKTKPGGDASENDDQNH